ncbi:MAG TPA: hypothetical protein VIG42_08575 [Solirubrobacteraceae bacterium]
MELHELRSGAKDPFSRGPVRENPDLMASLDELARHRELWWRIATKRQQSLEDAHGRIVTPT